MLFPVAFADTLVIDVALVSMSFKNTAVAFPVAFPVIFLVSVPFPLKSCEINSAATFTTGVPLVPFVAFVAFARLISGRSNWNSGGAAALAVVFACVALVPLLLDRSVGAVVVGAAVVGAVVGAFVGDGVINVSLISWKIRLDVVLLGKEPLVALEVLSTTEAFLQSGGIVGATVGKFVGIIVGVAVGAGVGS